MYLLKRNYLLFVIGILICTFIEYNAWSAGRPARRAARRERWERRQENKYQYIRSHDMNGDGTVDNKDRLMWLRSHQGGYKDALVSRENEDIIEAMDINGDGNVESWEMEEYYNSFDRNGDGVLDDLEIERATD